jgi:hypothetical protein
VSENPSHRTIGDDAGPAEPADLPSDLPIEREAAHGVPAYGTDFGLEARPQPSWVPPKAAPSQTASGGTGPDVPPAPSRPVRTITLGGAVGRAIGGRVQRWHVIAAATGLLIPVGFAVASSLGSDLDPIDRPVISVTHSRPVVTRTFPAPSITMIPGLPPTSKRTPPGTTVTGLQTTGPGLTARPPVVPVPALPVTPVPTDATRIRFEAYAQSGASIEVSLSDAQHQRYDYPVQKAPLAFETPITKNVSSTDYLSVRVRIYDPTASGDRGAVSCRILVDGVVVTTQQGRGSAACYISPYYDIRRP